MNSGVGSPVGAGRAGSIVGLGRGRVDREGRARRGRVGVAGRVGRADLEVWGPSARLGVVYGEEQAANGPPSMRHSKVEGVSAEVKVNVGVGSLVGPAGPESIVVCGVFVSTTMLAGGGGRVDVAGGVGGADLEGVGAVGQARGRARRGAGGEGAAVDAALEGRAGVVGAENAKVGVGSFVEAGGPGVDRGVRRARCRPRSCARRASGRCCRPGRSRGPGRCAAVGEVRRDVTARCR